MSGMAGGASSCSAEAEGGSWPNTLSPNLSPAPLPPVAGGVLTRMGGGERKPPPGSV